jgi:hypothetical protein
MGGATLGMRTPPLFDGVVVAEGHLTLRPCKLDLPYPLGQGDAGRSPTSLTPCWGGKWKRTNRAQPAVLYPVSGLFMDTSARQRPVLVAEADDG